MKLHNNRGEFQELITLTAREKHIPESAVERDYYIVRALLFLSQSEAAFNSLPPAFHCQVTPQYDS